MADQPSGTAIAVVQQAEVDGSTGKKLLEVKADVFSGDKIATGPGGSAQVIFRDNTKLVVGPNSLMTIDAFVFEGDSGRKITLNAAKGAFRFFTGNSPKIAYTINTPTATIGVRGTEFDLSVVNTGLEKSTRVMQFGGATRICRHALDDPTKLLDCVLHDQTCGVAVVRSGNHPIYTTKSNLERNKDVDRFFHLATDQGGLQDPFRVDTKKCGSLAYVPPVIPKLVSQ